MLFRGGCRGRAFPSPVRACSGFASIWRNDSLTGDTVIFGSRHGFMASTWHGKSRSLPRKYSIHALVKPNFSNLHHHEHHHQDMHVSHNTKHILKYFLYFVLQYLYLDNSGPCTPRLKTSQAPILTTAALHAMFSALINTPKDG